MSFGTNTYTPKPDKPATSRTRGRAGVPRQKAERRIIHPDLMEAKMHTSDPEWAAVLNNAARGVFVDKYIQYDGTYLTKRGSGIKEKMPSGNPKALATEFILFHKKHVSIYTSNDMANQERLRSGLESHVTDLTWSLCHSSMKRSRLSDYAKRMTDNEADSIELLAVLHSAQLEKKLNNKTVIMNNNKIVDVLVVSRTPEGVWYVSG